MTGQSEGVSLLITTVKISLKRAGGATDPFILKGECKPVMKDYLVCLKKVRGTNDPECRSLAKAYLQCRMDQ